MMKLRAIAFDLDDTLYPEIQYVQSGFRAVAAWSAMHFGIPAALALSELSELFSSGVRGNVFDLWLASHRLSSQQFVSTLVEIYRCHKPQIKPFPEIPPLLQLLRTRYRLGLLSDGNLEVQRRKLAALHLDHYFDAIVFSDEWGKTAWKPNVKCFRILIDKLEVSASEAVYVADNPQKDFLGARSAGLRTIWVRRAGLLYTHLTPSSRRYTPDICIDSMAALDTVLNG